MATKINFTSNMSAYLEMDTPTLHDIQRVHIIDYARIKEELALLVKLHNSGADGTAALRKEIEKLTKLKLAIRSVIDDFGRLIDSKDGTVRAN